MKLAAEPYQVGHRSQSGSLKDWPEKRAKSEFFVNPTEDFVEGNTKTYFQRARAKAGLSDKVFFHGLRHTYASCLLEGGVSLLTVADHLEHANTQAVSETYGHLTSKRKIKEIERPSLKAPQASISLAKKIGSQFSNISRTPHGREQTILGIQVRSWRI